MGFHGVVIGFVPAAFVFFGVLQLEGSGFVDFVEEAGGGAADVAVVFEVFGLPFGESAVSVQGAFEEFVVGEVLGMLQ